MKIIKVNFIILIIFILILIFFLSFLNSKYQGVPIYDKLGINLKDLKFHNIKKQAQHNEKEYLEYFLKYNSDEYIKLYKKKNNVNEIKKITGIDVNVFYFNDKNGCRENKYQDYLNSDVVLLGDSYLWGVSINNPFDITGNLEKKFPKKKILNLGTPGSGPVEQLQILKNLTIDNKFKNFVWFFYEGNDFHESTISKYDNKRLNCSWGYVNEDEEFNLKNEKLNEYNLITKYKIYLSWYLRGLNSFLKIFKNYDSKYNLNEKDYNIVLSEAKDYLDSKNVNKKIIYYIPSYAYQAFKKNVKHPQINKIDLLRSKVKDIAKKNDFEFIDGNIYLDRVNDRLELYHYGYPTHFNSLGYKLIADQVSQNLELN